MNHHIKNLCALIGYIGTIICITSQPQLVKWMLSAYIIYLVAIWISDEDND